MNPSLNDFFTWLDSYLNFEKTPVKNIFWLDTMKFLCSRLGNPQDSFTSIHIAGSKGKGSVAVMTASILEAGGFKTGLYTSPHIIDFRERICKPSGFFDDETYTSSAEEIMAAVNSIRDEELPGGRRLTWFEIVTAYAFLCFKNAGCTHAVIETGLGGRLDSTNIIKSSLCIITRMEKEHMEFLGDTIEKISFEKAGIIKPKTPVLVFSQKKNILDVFRLKAEEENAPVYFSDEEGQVLKTSYSISDKTVSMNAVLRSSRFNSGINADLKLFGSFQAQNALLASLGVKILYPDFDEKAMEKGLSKAFLPGRFEITENPWNRNLKLILDGAHTVSSAGFTIQTAEELFPKERKNLLFGCASDKDVEDMASLFADEFAEVTLTKPGSVKSCDIRRMEKAFSSCGMDFTLNENFSEAIPQAIKKAAEQSALLLVTGSFYLVSEVKKTLGTLLEIPQVIS